MVELAGVPQESLSYAQTILFLTDGEEALRTYWEERELEDGSSQYTLRDFDFWTITETVPYPGSNSAQLRLYEGMLIDDNYKAEMEDREEPGWHDGLIYRYRCYILDRTELIVVREGYGRVDKIYRYYFPNEFLPAEHMKENLQLGMSFPEVIGVLRVPPCGEFWTLAGPSNAKTLFRIGNTGQFVEMLFCDGELEAYRFLEPTGETVGDFWW